MVEPIESGRFIFNLVPATFFLQLFSGRKYTVPVLVKHSGDDNSADGKRAVQVFCGWWYGRYEATAGRNDFLVSAYDGEIEVSIHGIPWQKPWRIWTRKPTETIGVPDLMAA